MGRIFFSIILYPLIFLSLGMPLSAQINWTTLLSSANTLCAKGHYLEALSAASNAVAILETTAGATNTNMAFALRTAAYLYATNAQYTRAEAAYKRSAALYESSLGREHPEVAATIHGLAEIYFITGAFSNIPPLLYRAHAIRKKAFGDDTSELAASYKLLADMFYAQGRYDGAVSNMTIAVAMSGKSFAPDDSLTAAYWEHLAQLFQWFGQYPQAEDALEEAVGIRERDSGSNHADVAATLIRLAGVYEMQLLFADAKPLRQRAYDIWEKSFDRNRSETVTRLEAYAQYYQQQKKFLEAGVCLTRAHETLTAMYGPEHPRIAQNMNRRADLAAARGDSNAAIQLAQSAREMTEVFGAATGDTAEAIINVAVQYEKQHTYDRAIILYTKALSIIEKRFSPHHLEAISCRHSLGRTIRASGGNAQAVAIARRNRAACLSLFGAHHPRTADVTLELAQFYFDDEQYAMAEPLLVQARNGFRTAYPAGHPKTVTAEQYLADSYLYRGDYAGAAPLYAGLLAPYTNAPASMTATAADLSAKLGIVCAELQRNKEAQPLLERAIAYTASHADTAATVTELPFYLGMVYYRQEQYEQAKPLFERSVARYEQMSSPDRFSLITSKVWLGAAYAKLADDVHAQEQYDGINSMITALPDGNKQKPELYRLLTDQHTELKNYPAALQSAQQEFMLCEKKYGSNHPATLAFLSTLADRYTAAGDTAQAVLNLQRLRSCYDRPGTADTNALIDTLRRLGGLSMTANDLTNAYAFYTRVLTMNKKRHGTNSVRTAESMEDVGAALERMGSNVAAADHYSQALTIRERNLKLVAGDTVAAAITSCIKIIPLYEKTSGDRHPDTIRLIERLAALYRKAGREDEAKACDERVSKIRTGAK
ncbi:MAG: tetratricopeptide repeat protein [Spirochaetes bacterium]|nr:tetratricopeptide repeat protein [Spirochaetota bacterium]